MVHVNSKPTIKLLTGKFMKMNRRRNIIAVIAIVMTTVMFTALFTATVSVIQSNMRQEMRNCMDAAHISIQDLTKEQFDRIKDDPRIERWGNTSFLSTAENESLASVQTEIRYADKNGAEGFMSLPTTGSLPEKQNEIALSAITLDLMGVPRKVGSTVNLTFTANGGKQTERFVLSGYWKGDPLFSAQEAWVSKDFFDSHAKAATEEAIEAEDFEGSYNLSIWCSNIIKLNSIMQELDEEYNISSSQARIAVNPAYDFFVEDGFPVGTIAIVLLIIFLSGYLIIFNVFNISVKKDIREYGLLKNIGTTGRQLKKIVSGQALRLSAIGIPIGLLLGFLTGWGMTPYLLEGEARKAGSVITVHPLIFVISALFSLCTVYISYIRPCKIAARVSPVEAVRMTDVDYVGRNKKNHKFKKVTAFTMAAENLKMTWKKSSLVICSLMLSIILLNSVYTIITGFDYDKYLDVYISSDVNLSGCGHNLFISDLSAVSPEMLAEISERPEVDSVYCVYDTEIQHKLDANGYENLKKIISRAGESGYLSDYWLQKETDMLESREVPSHVMGISRGSFEKLGFVSEVCSWEDFMTGQYTIIEPQNYGLGEFYHPGDTVTVQLGEGKSKDYAVLAIAKMPYDFGYPYGAGTNFDYTFFIPEQEYIAATGNQNPMKVGIDTKEGKAVEFEAWLSERIENYSPQLYLDSRSSLLEDCKSFSQRYYVVLGILCGVLFVIGVMNFFNTSAVTMISRKRELSLLEAVGMTKKLIRKMLITEGMAYMAVAILIGDILCFPIMKLFIMKTVGKFFYFSYEPTILPSLVAIPVFAAVAVLIPLYNYKETCKASVVERIREQ